MIIVWGSEVLLLLGQIQGAESTREWTPHPFPITLWVGLVKTQIQSHSSPPCAVPCAVLSHFTRVQLFVTLWTYARHAPPSMDSPGKNTEWGTCLAVQWLRCLAFTARGMGLIHGWGAKLPHAMPYGQKRTKRILEWVAMPFSRGSSPPRDWTSIFHVSCIGRQLFTLAPLGKPILDNMMLNFSLLLLNTIKTITMQAQTA